MLEPHALVVEVLAAASEALEPARRRGRPHLARSGSLQRGFLMTLSLRGARGRSTPRIIWNADENAHSDAFKASLLSGRTALRAIVVALGRWSAKPGECIAWRADRIFRWACTVDHLHRPASPVLEGELAGGAHEGGVVRGPIGRRGIAGVRSGVRPHCASVDASRPATGRLEVRRQAAPYAEDRQRNHGERPHPAERTSAPVEAL
jgi:hypothetical protein